MSAKNRIAALVGLYFGQFSALMEKCRLQYLKSKLAYCGTDVLFYPRVSIILPEMVFIGDHTHLGENVHLRGGGKLTIGKWCQIANNTIILTGSHKIDGGLYYGRNIFANVEIADNVWIGANAIILAGVKIGKNSVIGAGAVVTEDVPANVIVAGVPARIIKTIEDNQSIGRGLL
jgi:acetyltransferase-like isoleucine patch superfamily enzyme